jgi:TRAP transporter TAXI family solute receptor
MKARHVVVMVLIVLLGSMPLFAGGGSETPAQQGTTEEKVVNIRCGGASVGGAMYVMAAAVSNVVNKYVPGVNFTVQTTSGGGENFVSLVNKKVEVIVNNSSFSYIGAQGGDPTQPTYIAGPNVRTWFAVEASPYIALAVQDNTKVKSFDDLWNPNLKIGTGAKGSSSYNNLATISKMLGKDFSKMNLYSQGQEQTANALKDGNIDITYSGVGFVSMPNSAFQELASATKVQLFDYPENLRDMMVKEMPYWGKVTLAPNWLNGYDKPNKTMAILNAFYVEESIPEDIMYQMTKALFEHLDELRSIYASFKTLDSKSAAVDAVVPFHPGALRYYEEKKFDISYRK